MIEDTVCRNLKLMQNVRMALPEVWALKDRMNTINLLIQRSGWASRYSGLNNMGDLLGIGLEVDMEDMLLMIDSLLSGLLKNLEEDAFTAQELRNLGREVDL